MGFSAPSFFSTGEYLIGSCRVYAMFASELLNRLTLIFQPSLGLCGSTDCGHSLKPFNIVQQLLIVPFVWVFNMGSRIQLSGIGSRLRQERERLGLSQKVFGEVGGVEANAQGKYENGERAPKADYLSRVAERGVDVLYVLTGKPTPILLDNLSQVEEKILVNYRVLQKEDQDAIRQLTTALAEMSANHALKKRQEPNDV